MIQLLSALVLLFGAPQDSAPEIVELPTNWSVGDRLSIEMVKTRAEFEDGKRLSSSGLRSMIRLEVIEVADASFVFRWDVDDVELGDITVDGQTHDGNEVLERTGTDDVVQDLLALQKGLSLELVTDEYGTPVSVRNLAEVREFCELSFDASLELYEEAHGSPPPPAATKAAKAMLTDRYLEGWALKDISMLFLPSGGSFEHGQRQAYESELPNPLGGPPFPAQAMFLLRTATPQNAVIAWRQRFDPEQTQAVLMETFTAMAKRMGKKPPTLDELPEIDITDDSQYVFDRRTGWPTELAWERRAVTGDRGRLQTLRFEVELAPPAGAEPK